MVRDFGIMIFQDFLLLVCVYLFLMPLHVMEKKKIKNVWSEAEVQYLYSQS